ncbi:MAG: phage portal protein [Mycobacteriaceae bacterium]
MSLFKREAPRELRQAFPEPIISPFPGSTSGGGGASISTALQVSAVWACVRLIADSVSMMPVHAFTMDGPSRKPIPDPPLLLHPSSDAGMCDWLYMLVVSLMLRGNAYGRVVSRDSLLYPTQIEWMHPDSVSVHVGDDGGLVYTVAGRELPKGDVKHVRAYRMPGSPLGLSPIQYAASAIQTDRSVQEFAYGFFRDGAHPSSILMSDEEFTQDQARSIKERFIASIQGREPSVLTGGMRYEQIQVSPNESQFLETQKYNVAQISRIFGVPPEMIAAEAGNSMTYANVEQRSLDFLTYSVQPWLTRLEAFLGTLLPGKRHVRFDTSVLLRTDLETRLKATAIGIASHQLLPDEARAMGDLPPFTDAEKAEADLIPMTVTPSGLPKALPSSAPAGEPASAAPIGAQPGAK